MKKSVSKLVISIVLTISFIIISIPIWNMSNGKKIGLFSVDYSNMPLYIEIGKFPSMIVIDDELALSTISPTSITIRNKNGYESDNYLYLLYDKNSTVDYSYLRVSINDTIYNLNEVEKEEDENNYYFKLNELKLPSYQGENYSARIWINPNATGLSSSTSLTTNFIIK